VDHKTDRFTIILPKQTGLKSFTTLTRKKFHMHNQNCSNSHYAHCLVTVPC